MNIVVLIFKIILFASPILLLLGVSLNIDFNSVVIAFNDIFKLFKELIINLFNNIQIFPNLYEILIIVIVLCVFIALIKMISD